MKNLIYTIFFVFSIVSHTVYAQTEINLGIIRATSLLPYWADGLKVGNFDNSANWQELSGIATAFKAENSNYLWVLSDAPANMLAAVSKSNASNQGVWSFQAPPTFVDLEDVESAVIGGQPYLYVFDFGNNGSAADSRGIGIDMRILRAKEPTITGSNGTIQSSDYISIDAVFPGGTPPTSRDCEASIIDPDTGKIYIITKRDATQKVYSLPHQDTYTGIQTLTYEGAMSSIPSSTTVPLGATLTYAVDAAINPSGTEILVKNYDNIYYFPRDKGTQTIMQALQQSVVLKDGYVGGGSANPKKSHPTAEPQGEGLCYSSDGRDLYTNSEYISTEGSTASRYPLFLYRRVNAIPTTVTFQEGISSYAGTSDTYIWGTTPTTDRGSETTFVLDITVGTPTDDRKTLLKFDLSSIPTTATVVGCKLNLWLAAEGQGWSWYRMLVPWTESSTYDSLVGGVDNDDIEAVSTASTVNGINLDTIVSASTRDNMLVSDCQAMVSNPSTNYGWLGENVDTATGDGVQFDSSESITAPRRPMLTVRYIN